jgi:hypothetical protein
MKRIPPDQFRNGYRVIAGTGVDGALQFWHFPTFQLASDFAQKVSSDTGKEVEITKYIGSWGPVTVIGYVAAIDV